MAISTNPWITFVEGDLLESDCTVLAHQCNCFSNMDCGLAHAIKIRYPEAYNADLTLKWSPEQRFGSLSVGITPGRKRIIFNLYGQYDIGPSGVRYTDYDKLTSALELMMEWIKRIARNRKDLSIKLGMPYRLGCGRGGGEWPTVLTILERLAESYERPISLYRHSQSASQVPRDVQGS